MTQPTAHIPNGLPSQGRMRLAVAGAAILAIAGLAAFYYASRKVQPIAAASGLLVTINDETCVPGELTVPAGRNTFRIVNATNRAVEWEIIDGVMVLEERENILPGFTQTVTAKLPAGEFEITCGLLNHPRGKLHVTPSAESAADAARPALIAFVGPLAEYQVYLALQGNALLRAVQALDAAIQAGDLAQARALYADTRRPYKLIEPMAESFADLDHAIAPVADYLEQREADPAFTGFHRLEYGLFAKNSTDGLAPVSTKLVADVTALKERLRNLKLSPERMNSGGARLIAALAETRIPAGEEHYAQTDLAEFEANLAGVTRMMRLMQPVTSKAAPAIVAEIEAKTVSVEAALAAMKGPDGYPPYGEVSAESRRGLSQKMQTLAGAIGKLNAAVGLE